jgi:transcriptional regulator with XRE-family HTH domain
MQRPSSEVGTGEANAYADELRSWRERRGLSKRALADLMAYDRTYVSHIEGCNLVPTEDFTRRAETALDAGGALWRRWDALLAARSSRPPRTARRDDRELRTADFVAWLADHSASDFRETYDAVAAAFDRLDHGRSADRRHRAYRRASVPRAAVASALTRYYEDAGEAHGVQLYRASVGQGAGEIVLSVLVEPTALGVAVPLGGSRESVGFVRRPSPSPCTTQLGVVEHKAAIARLAQVEASDTVMVNNPLYRLLHAEVMPDRLAATFTLSDFATYALTADLLEVELLDAICESDTDGKPERTPLRDRLLPTVATATALDARECVGGTVSLLAIARPERPGRAKDYALLIQERSSKVLNVTGRLAVIPKAFHQPTVDPAEEAALATTLLRELEEELLGRQDLEHLDPESLRLADPLHARHRSPPLTWLLDHEDTDALRMECTAFGINLVTGNYEFGCLTVIEDDQWWDRFGHQVEANWETMRVHRYSSLDTDGLAALATDNRWSNEGLFAFLEGLRRLTELDDSGRVAAPTITLEI